MRRLLLPLVAVALVLAACGSDNNKSSTDTTSAAKIACGGTGTLSGAGSTFVANIVSQWVKNYQAGCSGTTVNYQGVGSGAGIQQFINQYGTPSQLDFAGSDAVMKATGEEDLATAKGGAVLHIPWSGGGIALVYHLTGVSDLKLSPDVIAGIFSGGIKKWNDAKIAGDNTGVTLPDVAIEAVHRQDSSGTTNAFTSYLAATAPTVWTKASSKDWPYPEQPIGKTKSDQVVGEVVKTEGAIGYAEVSFARSVNMPMALVKNPAGKYVGPTAEGVSAALAEATVPGTLKVAVNFKPASDKAYPISTTTWAIVFKKQASAEKAALLKSFLSYALGAGQDVAPSLDYSNLPASILTPAKAAVESITS